MQVKLPEVDLKSVQNLETIELKDEVGKHVGLVIFITDAYATVTMAYQRAAGTYTIDKEMQQLGTAAVHLLTIATSYMTSHPPAEQPDEAAPSPTAYQFPG